MCEHIRHRGSCPSAAGLVRKWVRLAKMRSHCRNPSPVIKSPRASVNTTLQMQTQAAQGNRGRDQDAAGVFAHIRPLYLAIIPAIQLLSASNCRMSRRDPRDFPLLISLANEYNTQPINSNPEMHHTHTTVPSR